MVLVRPWSVRSATVRSDLLAWFVGLFVLSKTLLRMQDNTLTSLSNLATDGGPYPYPPLYDAITPNPPHPERMYSSLQPSTDPDKVAYISSAAYMKLV